MVGTYLGCSLKLRKYLCFVVEHAGLGGFSNCFDYQSIGNQSSSKILSGLTTPSPPPTTTMTCRCLQVYTSPSSVLNADDHGSPSVDDVDHHHPQRRVLTIRYVTPPCTAYTNKGLCMTASALMSLPLHQDSAPIGELGGLLLIWGFSDVFHCFCGHFRVNSSVLCVRASIRCIRVVAGPL